ncbi:hypothetical protein [Bartonella sp. MU70NMGDW]|uniref:hypothetical protein n=1 Tax=Bartonella sp. MU70NMGDW TaxID=3243561 RepID=UPI0035CF08AF
MQTFHLFFGTEHTHEEDILVAAKAANALEFIQALLGGFDTQVGERGTMLSEGKNNASVLHGRF